MKPTSDQSACATKSPQAPPIATASSPRRKSPTGSASPAPPSTTGSATASYRPAAAPPDASPSRSDPTSNRNSDTTSRTPPTSKLKHSELEVQYEGTVPTLTYPSSSLRS